MKKGSRVSCHKTWDNMDLKPTVIGMLEMPKADKSDTIPIAVDQAYMKYCSTQ